MADSRSFLALTPCRLAKARSASCGGLPLTAFRACSTLSLRSIGGELNSSHLILRPLAKLVEAQSQVADALVNLVPVPISTGNPPIDLYGIFQETGSHAVAWITRRDSGIGVANKRLRLRHNHVDGLYRCRRSLRTIRQRRCSSSRWHESHPPPRIRRPVLSSFLARVPRRSCRDHWTLEYRQVDRERTCPCVVADCIAATIDDSIRSRRSPAVAPIMRTKPMARCQHRSASPNHVSTSRGSCM